VTTTDPSAPTSAAEQFAQRSQSPVQRIQHVLHGHPSISPLLVLIVASIVFTIINPRLAESQIYGAIIMGISTALYEERIMDDATGRMLNSDMEFYKLAGIKDIGDIVVHLDIREVNDKRGVIGLGEPPAIGICAAVGNAVTNAIGVRVPKMPMTPMNVLNALEGRNA